MPQLFPCPPLFGVADAALKGLLRVLIHDLLEPFKKCKGICNRASKSAEYSSGERFDFSGVCFYDGGAETDLAIANDDCLVVPFKSKDGGVMPLLLAEGLNCSSQ